MKRVSLLLLLIILTPATHAESMVVLGGDSDARNCYLAAIHATQLRVSSHRDRDTCTRALEHGRLALRDRAATFVNRGVVLVALQDFNDALKDYQRAIKLKKDFGEVHVNIGNLHYMGRKFEEAIGAYSRALEVGLSKTHVAYVNRGMAYEKLRRPDVAEADYRRAIELAPEWSLARERLDHLLSKRLPEG